MTEPFKPSPPDGYTLHRQEVLPDGNARYVPPVPLSALASLLVFNGWQGEWQKPKFLFFGDPAWVATKENS